MRKWFIIVAVCALASNFNGAFADVCRDLALGVDRAHPIDVVNACHECGWHRIMNDLRQSYYDAFTQLTSAEMSRVGSPKTAWCGSENGGDHLQITFDRELKLGGLAIQGFEFGSWVTKFQVTYNDGNGNFIYIKGNGGEDQTFEGNSDEYGVEERKFPVPVKTEGIRIHPLEDHRGACIKVDVYACEDPNPSDAMVGMVSKSTKNSCTVNVLKDCEGLHCPKFKQDASGCEICECDALEVGDKFESDIDLNPTTKLLVEENFGGKSGTTDPGTVFKGASKIYGKWFDYKSSDGKILIPYVIGSGLSSQAQPAIQQAINHLSSKTCIQLVRRTNQQYYLNFMGGGGCSSPIGKTRGGNRVTIGRGCEHMGIVVHEILHSLGFWHEQSRPDRDSFIRIHYGNIQSGLAYNFQKRTRNDIDSFGSPYDLNSLMHYGGNAFSANGQPTITTVSGGRVVGQRGGLSREDIIQVNKMYKCEGTGGTGGGSTTATTATITAKPTTTAPPAPGNCVDRNVSCKPWADRGECDINPRYMEIWCKKSCDVCGGECVDNNRNCPGWKRYCTSKVYGRFMSMNCQSTCGKC